MRRNIIIIDEERCDGCGLCIPGCPEGALRVVDGKARLVGEVYCDGLGACIGRCPRDAIAVEERDAEGYDERMVIGTIARQGPGAVQEHLHHLREHQETESLRIAEDYLRTEGTGMGRTVSPGQKARGPSPHDAGCPGAAMMDFSAEPGGQEETSPAGQRGQLRQWPVQLHLVSPQAPYFQGSDVVLAADCVAYALGDFHQRFLRGKSLAIACPKLDEGQDAYKEKVAALIDGARINTLTVVTMEVPCCAGLVHLACEARDSAGRKAPIKSVVVGIQGDILSEEWVA